MNAISGGPSPIEGYGKFSSFTTEHFSSKFLKDVTLKILEICPKHRLLFSIHVKLKFQKFEVTFFLIRHLPPFRKIVVWAKIPVTQAS